MVTQEIQSRLFDCEDRLTERKLEGVSTEDLRKTLVAFANSTPAERVSILFLGVSDDGKVLGVKDTDKLQKEIRKIAETRCFPPVKQTCEVVEHHGKTVVAVLVPSNDDRPHFSGHAYVRIGSETTKASAKAFEELVASRNEKARKIIAFKEQVLNIRWRSTGGFYFESTGSLEFCDAHSCTIRENSDLWAFPLSDVEVITGISKQLTLVVKPPWTESEQIKNIVQRWRLLRSTEQRGLKIINDNYLISQLLANPEAVLPVAASEADGSSDLCLKSLLAHVRFELKKRGQPKSKIQKQKYVEVKFCEMMRGQHPTSATAVIAATIRPIAEVTTSLEEAKELIGALQHHFPESVSVETIWNALMWEIGIT